MTGNMNLRVYRYGHMSVYNAAFHDLSDMHMYIQSSPEVNREIFRDQHSIIKRADFPGDTFRNAVDYLIGGYKGDCGLTMRMLKELEKTKPIIDYTRRRERSVAGSHPNIPAYVAGVPKTMYRLSRLPEKKFVTIWFNLAYPVWTTERAVTNRGALTLSLIKLLEESGIGVDLKVFSSCYAGGEVFNCEICLKSPSEPINMKKCFYPMCSVMFLRRIVMRVMESMPFKDKDWYPNYGQPLTEEQFRLIFDIPENDIVISAPADMGILGKKITEDGERFFKKIELEKYFGLQRATGA